jgi:antitoxin (DNA-binding transcriptional repressor) of toxin-antitoxin stability system
VTDNARSLGPVRTVNRRELNQRSGQIIDEVLRSGEPIEVLTRGRGSVIIAPKPASVYEQWKAQGLIKPATGRLSETPRARSPRSVQELLDDIRGDR